MSAYPEVCAKIKSGAVKLRIAVAERIQPGFYRELYRSTITHKNRSESELLLALKPLLSRYGVVGIHLQCWGDFNTEAKHLLAEKFDSICWYCGVVDHKLTLDHVIPKSRGGGDRFDNVVPARRKVRFNPGKVLKEVLSRPS